jgi:hypothetical protein
VFAANQRGESTVSQESSRSRAGIPETVMLTRLPLRCQHVVIKKDNASRASANSVVPPAPQRTQHELRRMRQPLREYSKHGTLPGRVPIPLFPRNSVSNEKQQGRACRRHPWAELTFCLETTPQHNSLAKYTCVGVTVSDRCPAEQTLVDLHSH